MNVLALIFQMKCVKAIVIMSSDVNRRLLKFILDGFLFLGFNVFYNIYLLHTLYSYARDCQLNDIKREKFPLIANLFYIVPHSLRY